MVELAKRGSSLNSLWSIIYCVLVLFIHGYITYLGISKYQRLNDDDLWGGKTPGELRAFIVLIVLGILFLPLFVFTSILKVGNTANDGRKLGRDHALDCSAPTIGTRIPWMRMRHLWEQFPPFSSVLQLTSAFLILLPEIILTAAEVKYGVTPSDAVWSCDLDFLFDNDRVMMSNIIGQSNVTVLANMSYYVVPTPKPPPGGWTKETSLHVAFIYLAAGLFVFSVRYAAVFWFTNKVFGIIFTVLLILMSIESLFAFCGTSVLYKLSVNYELYTENISIILGPGVILFLYILSGIVLLFSTMIVYCYGANYFQEKFKIIDKRHNPDAYRKQEILLQGSCQGYMIHTSAMVSFVLLALLKGAIIYDLVTLYKVTKDSMILTCIVIDVCYMIVWVVLWIILTLKHKWQFRILDYIPLNKPIFMISTENLGRAASLHSLEIRSTRKRPSSLPSEMTASESGFGDMNSSEDERERFELSLPPLAEHPGLIHSRRKGSTHSLDRKFRGRRNGHQRVTFHETVKRSSSIDNSLYPEHMSRREIAEVHRQARTNGGRPPSRGERTDSGARSTTPIDVEMLRSRRLAERQNSAGRSVTPVTTINNDLYNRNNDSLEIKDSCVKVKDINTDKSNSAYGDLTIKNDYAQCSKSNLKALNIQTQTSNSGSTPKSNGSYTDSVSGSSALRNSIGQRKEPNTIPVSAPKSAFTRTHLSPTPIDFIDKKHDISLSRRDSANYSLTSSQETASNESDHTHQAMCSQAQRKTPPE